MYWTQTAIVQANGVVKVVPDDWVIERDGAKLARIHKICVGAQESRWLWAVMIAPDGSASDGDTGYARNVREARKQCEARIAEHRRPADGSAPGIVSADVFPSTKNPI